MVGLSMREEGCVVGGLTYLGPTWLFDICFSSHPIHDLGGDSAA